MCVCVYVDVSVHVCMCMSCVCLLCTCTRCVNNVFSAWPIVCREALLGVFRSKCILLVLYVTKMCFRRAYSVLGCSSWGCFVVCVCVLLVLRVTKLCKGTVVPLPSGVRVSACFLDDCV